VFQKTYLRRQEMKKVLTVIVVLVFAMMFSVSCAKKSSTPTAPSGPVPVVISFGTAADAVLTSYNNDTADTAFTGSSYDNTSADADGGTGCLSVTSNFVYGATATTKKGQISVVFGTTTEKDLTKTGNKVTFKVYIPAALATVAGNYGYQVQVFSDITGNQYNYSDGGWQALPTTAGWHTLSWDLAAVPPASGDLTKVTKIAVQFTDTAAAGDGSYTLLVDDITY
jgi:hypothetical protein